VPVGTELTRQVLGFILAGGESQRLRPLTERRAKPAMPFGAAYRIIDFALSNCVNSNIRRICVLTQYESLILQRHLRSAWNILSRDLGEFVDVLVPQQVRASRWYRGTADGVFQHLHVLQEQRPQWVLILMGDHVYRMDYGRLLDAHLRHGGAATVVCREMPVEQAKAFGVVQTDACGRVEELREKPEQPAPLPGTPERALVSMGIYLFTTEDLVQAVVQDARTPGSSRDLTCDVLPCVIRDGLVHAYRFESQERAYWRDVGTLDSYWQAHMDLIDRHPEFDLYDSDWPIRPGLGVGPPAKICTSTEGTPSTVQQSLVGPGSLISGACLRRCTIGPRVEVHNGSELEECVVMGEVYVGKQVRLKRAIVEEGVRIPDGTALGHDPEEDSRAFRITDEGVLIVPQYAPL